MSIVSNNILAGASGQGGGGYEIERSLRFNSGDSSYLSRQPSATGNRKTWTWSGWVKRSKLGSLEGLFGAGVSNTDYTGLYFQNDNLKLEDYPGGGTVATNAVFRDPSSFYHVVLAVDTTLSTAADRVKIYVNGIRQDTTGTYAQDTQTRINKTDIHKIGEYYPSGSSAFFNGYLADVHFIDGQALAPTDFGETDEFGVWQPKEFNGAYFTGVSNATGAVPIYNTNDAFGLVKGTGYRSDSFAGTTNGTGLVLAIPGDVATDVHHLINTGSSQATVTNDGVVAVTSNSRLYGSSLEFQSSNTDSLTVQNSDMAFGTGDFCVEFWVYNKTNKNYNAFISTRDANGASSGFVIASNAAGDLYVYAYGFLTGTVTLPLNQWCHVAYTRASGTHRLFLNGVATTTTTTSRDFTYGTLKIGDNPYALDEPINAEMQDIRVYKGVAKYTSNFRVPARASNGFYLDFKDNSSSAALGYDAAGSNNWTVNNLTATTPGLATANQGMDVVTWTGNGSNSRAITGLSFSPGLLWIKRRNSSLDHFLWDSVRGVSKELNSNQTYAEGTATNKLASLDANGFTVKNNSAVNTSGDTYVAWAWKAGGAASSNTDGSITSSVSANTTYGFSVVSYTGDNNSTATIGHGLNAKVAMVITKARTGVSQWMVYHQSLSGNTAGNNPYNLYLNGTSEELNITSFGSYNNINSSVVPVTRISGATAHNNNNGVNYIAYCWSEVAGFSKFGSYTGTGASAQTIECGFPPAYVIVKNSTGVADWAIYDKARGNNNFLIANTTVANNNIGASLSFTTTGFTVQNWSTTNGSGSTFIYAAFAANPDGSVIDSLLDTPTNGDPASDTGAGGQITGNYATLNPLSIIQTVSGDTSKPTFSNGNLTYDGVSGKWGPGFGSIAIPSTGKWYFEATISSSGSAIVGIAKYLYATGNRFWDQGAGTQTLYKNAAGSIGYSGTSQASGTALSAGDIVGVGINCDDDEAKFYRNGALDATVTIPAAVVTAINNGEAFPFVDTYNGIDWNLNFGQRSYSNSNVPSGYKSLCTTNLPEPTIADGSLYFDTKVWTGDGTGSRSFTGYSFSPDFAWVKSRSLAYTHVLWDAVRGAGVSKELQSDSTNAEGGASTNASGYLSAFNSDGFSSTAGTSDNDYFNKSGQTYVGWAWEAASSNTTIAAGSLNSSVYNQTQTWSNNWTASGNGFGSAPPANCFDANFNNAINNSAGGQYITWNTTSYTLSGTLEINVQSSSGVYDVYVNGTKASDTPSSRGWINCGSFTDINEIQFGGSSHNSTSGLGSSVGIYIYEIKVAGKTLVDYGVTPPNVPSIASTVRANPSAGFSIVKYVGTGSLATVGHNLNSAPEFMIIKGLDDALSWGVYANSPSNYLQLQDTGASNSTDASNSWDGTAPTSSVFTVKTKATVNESGENYIAYCFAPVAGYSAMGSYTGNGSSSDGPFIHTGFKIAWLMVKRTDVLNSWVLYDSKRNTFNVVNSGLLAEDSRVETDFGIDFDFLSNGFKIRSAGNPENASGGSYIYLAFASNPFASNGGLAR